LLEKAGDTIHYGLDSHFGCAARYQIHAPEGGYQEDGGVRSDIISKLMTARGILQLRREMKEKGEDVAEIIPTFFPLTRIQADFLPVWSYIWMKRKLPRMVIQKIY
jgi:hypothetical protein